MYLEQTWNCKVTIGSAGCTAHVRIVKTLCHTVLCEISPYYNIKSLCTFACFEHGFAVFCITIMHVICFNMACSLPVSIALCRSRESTQISKWKATRSQLGLDTLCLKFCLLLYSLMLAGHAYYSFQVNLLFSIMPTKNSQTSHFLVSAE